MSKIIPLNAEESDNNNNANTGVEEYLKPILDILEIPDELFKTMEEELISELTKGSLSNEIKDSLLDAFSDNSISFEDIDYSIKALQETKENLVNLGYCEAKVHFIEAFFNALVSSLCQISEERTTEVKIELMNEDAKVPTYANPTDAGADIYCSEETTIAPGQTKLVHTGIKVAVPVGYMLNIYPRSGMSLKTPIRIANSVGVIDSGYRGEICVICSNTNKDTSYVINKGDRIAQAVLSRIPKITFSKIESVTEIGEDRGGGFGSSDNVENKD